MMITTISEQLEYNGDTYPEGQWAVDFATFEGLEKITRTSKKGDAVTFVMACGPNDTFTIREASPLGKKVAVSMAFPDRLEAEGSRGPLAKWTVQAEEFALKCLLYSRAKLGSALTWRFIPTLNGFELQILS